VAGRLKVAAREIAASALSDIFLSDRSHVNPVPRKQASASLALVRFRSWKSWKQPRARGRHVLDAEYREGEGGRAGERERGRERERERASSISLIR